jgi:hypothetical protein
MHQIRAEQIEFVIQSDKLTHQLVLHLAVHQFIVPTIGVTRLRVYNAVERLQLACDCTRTLSANREPPGFGHARYAQGQFVELPSTGSPSSLLPMPSSILDW